MAYIYKIINCVNGKIYIGKTLATPEQRWKEHVRDSQRAEYSERPLYKAFRKYGIENFQLTTIETCDYTIVNEREKYWIGFYNSKEEGYNLTIGGQSYRGQENPQARLTDDEVKQIIILLEEHRLNNGEIAKLFSVCRNTIDGINRCKSWCHLHSYKTLSNTFLFRQDFLLNILPI